MRRMLSRVLLFLLLGGQVSSLMGQPASWQAQIGAQGEPGEALLVSGRVLGQDGSTPVPGARVYMYHTDLSGSYGPGGSDAPRLHATMITDAAGRYELRTIRPGSYPRTRNPAHIHYVVSAPGFQEREFEIMFEDDPFVSEDVRKQAAGGEGWVILCKLARNEPGILSCVQDVRLRPV